MTPQNDLITIPAIEDVTRRQFMSGALAAALLIACGSDDEEAAPQATTRIVTDAYGNQVELPANPKRIVSISSVGLGALLSLGASVVGAVSNSGDQPEPFDATFFEFDGVSFIGTERDLDLEAVAALSPDLIVDMVNVTMSPDPVRTDWLQAIAPLLMVDFSSFTLINSTLAEALGIEPSVLNSMRNEYQGALDKIRGLLGDGWKNVTVTAPYVSLSSATVFVPPTGAGGTHMDIFEAVGAVSLNQTRENMQISIERMREIDCDILLYPFGEYVPLNELPETFQQLRVVQAGQVIADMPDFFRGQHYPAQIALANWFLEKLTKMMPIRTDIV